MDRGNASAKFQASTADDGRIFHDGDDGICSQKDDERIIEAALAGHASVLQNSIALKRISNELFHVIRNDYLSYFSVLNRIKSEFQARLILVSGTILDSYLAYLMGLTGLDALDYDYRIAFGYNFEKLPYTYFIVPSGYKKEMVGRLKSVICDGPVSESENSIIIREKFRFGVFENTILNTIERSWVNLKEDVWDKEKNRMLDPNTYNQVGNTPFEFESFVEKIRRAVHEYLCADICYKQADAIIRSITDYTSLKRAIAVILGRGLYIEAGLMNQMFYTRDDVLRILLKHYNEKDAVFHCERIRKGMPTEKELIGRMNSDFIEQCKRVTYLVTDAECTLFAQCICYVVSHELL